MAETEQQQDLIAKLERENMELKAQLVFRHHFASRELDKFTIDRMTGSCVIVSMVALGGKTKMDPIAIRDGLSDETIASLKKDIQRSYDSAVEFKP